MSALLPDLLLLYCAFPRDLVIYVEACESGSIFEGLLSDGLNIYATTASNARESCWGTYCPGAASICLCLALQFTHSVWATSHPCLLENRGCRT